MRPTFVGLGLAVKVVFLIMAAQFASPQLPFVMLFTARGALGGIVLALLVARPSAIDLRDVLPDGSVFPRSDALRSFTTRDLPTWCRRCRDRS